MPVGQMALADGFELQWGLTAGAGCADGVGGEIEKELAGERVVPRMEWLESGGDVAEVVTVGKTAHGDVDPLGGGLRRSGGAAPPCRTTRRLRRQRPVALDDRERKRREERHFDGRARRPGWARVPGARYRAVRVS